MIIAGIIAEYNPFHNGHWHHIEETRKRTGCNYVVAVMSGSFTQRGEAAMCSKWLRAEMALRCGVDAVFELPALFAVRTADWFARGGVGIVSGLGCDYLSFGSEISDMEFLARLADLRFKEPLSVSQGIRKRLDMGMSHARARGEAVAEFLDVAPEALNRPNAALGVEYLCAIRALHSKTVPVIVPRIGDYHAEKMANVCSATAIRAALNRGADIADAVPEACEALIPKVARLPLDMAALYRLRQGTSGLPDAGEGLDGLLFRAARESGTLEEAIDRVKSRRYTRARIARAVAHALGGLDTGLVAKYSHAPYARLIGMRTDAKPLLSEISRRAEITIAPDPALLAGDECFQLECRFTDAWALGEPESGARRAGRDFTERFVRI